MSDAPEAGDRTPDHDAHEAHETHERAHRSQRDVDLGGRDRVAMARMAALNGDPGAAHAIASGAAGSGDPAVAGEAAAVHGAADAAAAHRAAEAAAHRATESESSLWHRLRRRRRWERRSPVHEFPPLEPLSDELPPDERPPDDLPLDEPPSDELSPDEAPPA